MEDNTGLMLNIITLDDFGSDESGIAARPTDDDLNKKFINVLMEGDIIRSEVLVGDDGTRFTIGTPAAGPFSERASAALRDNSHPPDFDDEDDDTDDGDDDYYINS